MEFKLTRKTQNNLKKLGVAAVYGFGSQFRKQAHFFSDLDIGVVFTSPQESFQDLGKLVNRLYKVFSDDFDDEVGGIKLDISLLERANPALGMSAVKHGRLLLEIDPVARVNFEESLFKRYNDYKPLAREYAEANIRAFLDS